MKNLILVAIAIFALSATADCAIRVQTYNNNNNNYHHYYGPNHYYHPSPYYAPRPYYYHPTPRPYYAPRPQPRGLGLWFRFGF